jgi:hypothetical protein
MPPKRRNKSAPVVNPADSPSQEVVVLTLQQGISPGQAACLAHPGVFWEWEAHFKATGSSTGFTPVPRRSPQAGHPVSESLSQQNTPTQANFITSGLAEHARIESSILKWPHEASLLNVDSRVRGGESNGSRYESNGLELTVIYCEQV